MPNTYGPATFKRLLYVNIVHSIILYGAPIQTCAVNRTERAAKINSVQRLILLRAIGAYRTASTVTTNIIAGVPPLDLSALERKIIWERTRILNGLLNVEAPIVSDEFRSTPEKEIDFMVYGRACPVFPLSERDSKLRESRIKLNWAVRNWRDL